MSCPPIHIVFHRLQKISHCMYLYVCIFKLISFSLTVAIHRCLFWQSVSSTDSFHNLSFCQSSNSLAALFGIAKDLRPFIYFSHYNGGSRGRSLPRWPDRLVSACWSTGCILFSFYSPATRVGRTPIRDLLTRPLAVTIPSEGGSITSKFATLWLHWISVTRDKQL